MQLRYLVNDTQTEVTFYEGGKAACTVEVLVDNNGTPYLTFDVNEEAGCVVNGMETTAIDDRDWRNGLIALKVMLSDGTDVVVRIAGGKISVAVEE